MMSDAHTLCRTAIDERLVAGASLEADARLLEHLQACLPCQEYLEASRRVIASLGNFAFERNAALEARVFDALEVRARQLTPAPMGSKVVDPRRLLWASLFAVFLAVAGSLVDLGLGNVLASLLHVHAMAVRQEVLLFWVVPSLVPLLLFPLLPVLAQRNARFA